MCHNALQSLLSFVKLTRLIGFSFAYRTGMEILAANMTFLLSWV